MSNLEHLIENALCLQQEALKKKSIDDEARQKYITQDYNIEMAKRENISLESIWQMAQYVTYTWCEGKILDDLES